MIKALILSLAAATLLVSAITESPAQGSMAPEVRVVIVKPSRTILRLNAQHAAEKAATRARLQSMRDGVRQMEKRQRDFERLIEQDRKAYVKKLGKK